MQKDSKMVDSQVELKLKIFTNLGERFNFCGFTPRQAAICVTAKTGPSRSSCGDEVLAALEMLGNENYMPLDSRLQLH